MASRSTTSSDDERATALRQRAAAVAAFKSRVDTRGMTRPARSPEERAFLKSVGAEGVFLED